MAWNHWLLRVAAALTSALAFYFSTGFHTLWPLAWLAPLPILMVALGEDKARPAAAVAFLAYFLGSLNLLTYLLRMAPAGAVAVFLAGPALVFVLSVLVARRVARRTRHWAAVFAFPAAWTSYEFLLSSVSPHGTFGSLAYSQTDVLPLIQIASITGALGITFLVLLVPSALAFGWYFRGDRRRAVLALGVPLGLLIVALGFGWARLAQPSAAPPVPVGLAVKDATIETFETERPEVALPVVDAYARRVRTLAGRGAEVVVLPEKFVGVTPAYAAQVYERLASAAREGHAWVVAGLHWSGPSGKRNVAVVFGPDGRVLAEYDKTHLVPGLEAEYRPGNGFGLLRMGERTWGTAICKDMDFSRLGRRYSRAEVGLMLIPAWDFVRDGRAHSRMAVLRGVEGGYAVVRTAQDGNATVSDDRGRILAEAASSSAPEVLLSAEVTPGPGRTFYSAAGDWMGWLSVLSMLVLLVAARRSFI
jgi:apolipoprotein N-acyltransferase